MDNGTRIDITIIFPEVARIAVLDNAAVLTEDNLVGISTNNLSKYVETVEVLAPYHLNSAKDCPASVGLFHFVNSKITQNLNRNI